MNCQKRDSTSPDTGQWTRLTLFPYINMNASVKWWPIVSTLRIPRKFTRLTWLIPATALLVQVSLVWSLRWIDPHSSAIIRRDQRHQRQTGSIVEIQHQWVDLSQISRNMQLAVIAAEDQKFSRHFGFDLPAIIDAMDHNTVGRTTRGASTITQQVAKNLFLWPARSWLRKGLEAYYTLCIELLWPKERILEIYLNIAQFDNHLYGVDAAASRFFGESPAGLSRYQSALLASVLPNPSRYDAGNPSPYLTERTRWIQEQMSMLGVDGLNWR